MRTPGAPVPPWLWAAMREVMPRGLMHSPYGATEALPVSTISADEIAAGPQSIARGRKHYLQMSCHSCHGDDGTGARDAFLSDVDRLREGCDRLEARLARLRAETTPTPQG